MTNRERIAEALPQTGSGDPSEGSWILVRADQWHALPERIERFGKAMWEQGRHTFDHVGVPTAAAWNTGIKALRSGGDA